MNYMQRRNNELSYENPFFDDFFTLFDKESKLLRSDIKETKDKYIINVEVPGYNKEDINLSLEDKYLTLSINKKEEKEDNGERYIHKEIYNGHVSRSYYVGEVKESDIDASFTNGILSISFAKESYNNKETKKLINIH